MNRLVKLTLSVTTTGLAGAAAGSASVGIPGVAKLLAVSVIYNSMPATTDVTIKYRIDGIDTMLLTLTNRNTNLSLSRIKTGVIDSSGAAIAGVYDDVIVAGELVADVAQADAAVAAVTVSVIIEL